MNPLLEEDVIITAKVEHVITWMRDCKYLRGHLMDNLWMVLFDTLKEEDEVEMTRNGSHKRLHT